jgi:hypothetical protein
MSTRSVQKSNLIHTSTFHRANASQPFIVLLQERSLHSCRARAQTQPTIMLLRPLPLCTILLLITNALDSQAADSESRADPQISNTQSDTTSSQPNDQPLQSPFRASEPLIEYDDDLTHLGLRPPKFPGRSKNVSLLTPEEVDLWVQPAYYAS